MREPEHPEPAARQGRLERRHGRARAIERRRQWLSDRDAFLESLLEPGERVTARTGSHPLVTDRRILSARQLRDPSSGRDWILDPLAFDQIVVWSQGAHHDGRPLIQLTHLPLTRITRIPAHRFLWWTWGNAVGSVVETTTTLAFGRRTNPVFRAIGAELDRRRIPRGPAFEIRPPGTRAERLREGRGSPGELKRAGILIGMRVRMWRVTDVVYRGQLAWPLRALSWILVASLAWLASPWLVLPAIVASELVWIVVMRWSSPGRDTVRSTDVDAADQPAP